MAQGKTHTQAGKLNGKGSGKTMRDASVANSPAGGSTKVIDRTKGGHLKRSKGSFKSYC